MTFMDTRSTGKSWWARRRLRRLEVRRAGLIMEIATRAQLVKAADEICSWIVDPWIRARIALAEVEKQIELESQ